MIYSQNKNPGLIVERVSCEFGGHYVKLLYITSKYCTGADVLEYVVLQLTFLPKSFFRLQCFCRPYPERACQTLTVSQNIKNNMY